MLRYIIVIVIIGFAVRGCYHKFKGPLPFEDTERYIPEYVKKSKRSEGRSMTEKEKDDDVIPEIVDYMFKDARSVLLSDGRMIYEGDVLPRWGRVIEIGDWTIRCHRDRVRLIFLDQNVKERRTTYAGKDQDGSQRICDEEKSRRPRNSGMYSDSQTGTGSRVITGHPPKRYGFEPIETEKGRGDRTVGEDIGGRSGSILPHGK